MASLHSSPWTQHNIHVGHSPRNGSVPSVYILRSTRELIRTTFSKGSATEPASVIERRALFRKKCLFLLLLVYYVYQLLRRSNVYRWRTQDMHFYSCPFPFQPWLCDMCARIFTHRVNAHCCFYWCCPSCTFIRQVIYPQSQKFKIYLNSKINSFD